MSNTLFVYGTLMNPEVLLAVTGRQFDAFSAVLKGYRRVAVIDQLYPAILPDKNGVVTGQLITGLTNEDQRLLDQFEGDYYQAEHVKVSLVDGEKVNCICYVFKNEYLHLLSDNEWSNESFREHHLSAFLGL